MGTKASLTFKTETGRKTIYQKYNGDPDTVTESVIGSFEKWGETKDADKALCSYVTYLIRETLERKTPDGIIYRSKPKNWELDYKYLITFSKDNKIEIKTTNIFELNSEV